MKHLGVLSKNGHGINDINIKLSLFWKSNMAATKPEIVTIYLETFRTYAMGGTKQKRLKV